MSTNYGANNDIYLQNDVTAHSSVIKEKFKVDNDGVGNDDMNNAFHSNNVNGELTNATNKFVRQHGYLVLDDDKRPHNVPTSYWVLLRTSFFFFDNDSNFNGLPST